MVGRPRSSAEVLVLGLGGSGLAAARLAAADGSAVRVSDLRPQEELSEVLARLPDGVEHHLGSHPEFILDGVDTVVVSPGVPAEAPILAAARARRLTVLSEVEFAWRHRREAPLIAITGSNGKSTVTVLAAEMLKAAGLRAVAGGNLGTAASDLMLDEDWDCWVLEISSFQSEIFQELRPAVGVLLNLSQDHLERHPDMASYLDAKRKVFACQGELDLAVLNADDPSSAQTPTRGRRLSFSVEGPADACLEGEHIVIEGKAVLDTKSMALVGRHNVANAMAAALAARDLGASREAIAEVLRGFEGLDHRHRKVFAADQVQWIDDSKATNVGATKAALAGYPAASVHLILGGLGKGQDFSVLRAEVERAARMVYTIGEDARLIEEALVGTVHVEHCGTLEVAVRRARAAATAGESVLLAPACASFDQFSSYAERGDCFAKLARQGGAPCP